MSFATWFSCAAILTGALACSSSTAKPPADPVRTDLDVFCSPEAAEKANSPSGLSELGPYVEPKMHSTEMLSALAELKSGSVEVFSSRMAELMSAHHLERCATLDRMLSKRPATP